MWQIIFSNAAEFWVGDLGFFSCLLQAKPQPLGSSRSLHPVPVCPNASMWVQRLLCQAVWDAKGKWDAWRTHISAEPVVFIPLLLNSSPWKRLFCILHNTASPTLYLQKFGLQTICLYSSPSHPVALSNPLHINIHHWASPSKANFSLPTLSSLGKDEVNQLFSWSQRLPGCGGRWIAALPFMSNAEESEQGFTKGHTSSESCVSIS